MLSKLKKEKTAVFMAEIMISYFQIPKSSKTSKVKFSEVQLLVNTNSKIIAVFLYFHFSFFYLFPGGIHVCLHAKSRNK